MKIAGILSKNIDYKKFKESVKLLVRNKREKLHFESAENFIIAIIYHPHETFRLHNQKDLIELIFHDQFTADYEEEIIDKKMIRNPEDIKELKPMILRYYIEESKIIIFSDFFGFKSLYYTNINESLFFSTEIKTILNYYDKGSFTSDQEGLVELFLFGFQWGNKTLHNEIKMLDPRRKLIYYLMTEKISISQYIFYSPEQITSISTEIYQDLFNSFNSVFANLKKENEVIIWLSGGLDSRLILTTAIKQNIDIKKVINFGFDYTRDKKYADIIIDYFKQNNKKIHYEIDGSIISKYSIFHLWVTEGYSSHLNSHLRYGLEIAIKNAESNVILYDGNSGDAILGGTYAKRVSDLFSTMIFDKKFLKRALTPVLFSLTENYDRSHFDEVLNENFRREDKNELKQEMMLYDYYCRRVVKAGGTKIGEDFGIVRLPFFNRDFFDICLKIPVDRRKDHFVYKKFVEQFHPNILKFPSTSLKLKSLKPSKIKKNIKKYKILILRLMERVFRKQFIIKDVYVDPNEMLRRNKDYRNLITSVLFDERTVNRGFFNVESLKTMFIEHLSRKHNYGTLFAKLFDFEITLRMFSDSNYQIPITEFKLFIDTKQ